MQVHDGVVLPLVVVDLLVKVQAGDDVGPLCQAMHLLQEVHVADVEQVKGAGHVDDRLPWLGSFPEANWMIF